jgi:hypothetical protein
MAKGAQYLLASLVAAAALGVVVSAASVAEEASRWWAPNEGRVFPASLSYPNANGTVTTLSLAGPVETRNHPFFTSLGSNGRACVTCHQPADGMSISVTTIQHRWQATEGKDPLFAAIDGSDCPSLGQQLASSHSLLLQRGLFRIARPWPPRDAAGKVITPEFKIEVIRDPTHCNLDPVYGLHSKNPTVSVYRRTRPATNLKYLTAVGFPFEPKTGLPLPLDPETGQQVSGNILSDSRDPTLRAQAMDAMRVHLQVMGDPDAAQIAQIIAFESEIYTAQSTDKKGGKLDGAGAKGGPATLASVQAGALQYSREPIWQEFLPWSDATSLVLADSEEQRQFRASVARGADVFVNRSFLISDSAGITNMGFGNPVRNGCAFCHNMQRTGMDVAPGQIDIGITNSPFAESSTNMPLFRLTCGPNFAPHPHLGAVVFSQDPGYALTTGRCRDIGKITAQQMRALAARPPYFSDGSAKTIREIVDYYDRRYRIGYTEQEKQDLTNLMSVL